MKRDATKPRPDPISMRLPVELKDCLGEAAKAAGRSLNAEIRMRLEWSFEGGFDGQASDKMLANEVESLRAELRGGIANLNADIEALKGRLKAIE
ncbi:Arc family DNA-binding protein [Aurantimonas sp. C2-6-R+9]|uniref:Arc family DNA-binding protein n=1 Tax=unclassified Aurantimonas TaxID=2638230 RepID=UPI002E17291C|nr:MULTISPECIES: Arc family DNA-binding protein [unclassified Aurantimonas]MEC5291367.1 Arc family DNA-binding protein [Aurantimonas sp. C2-3-R2]MEC5381573.1 Arc family DNA-binding protein [Aurantimonas sp. C2-6-R+9]MEC5412454.1 Arc family DNA-binding protein [Aurantimonas sp. C2-4-R8]